MLVWLLQWSEAGSGCQDIRWLQSPDEVLMISCNIPLAWLNIHLGNNIHCALLEENFQKNTIVMKYELCP